MPKSLLRPLGFLLTFIAIAAFILHPKHVCLDNDSGSASSHCCVCHTVPMGAARPGIDHAPVVYVVYKVAAPAPSQPVNVLFSLESPRGPPFA